MISTNILHLYSGLVFKQIKILGIEPNYESAYCQLEKKEVIWYSCPNYISKNETRFS